MIRIIMFNAITATLPVGSAAFEPEVTKASGRVEKLASAEPWICARLRVQPEPLGPVFRLILGLVGVIPGAILIRQSNRRNHGTPAYRSPRRGRPLLRPSRYGRDGDDDAEPDQGNYLEH
jgi:hypothetical protein